MGMEFLELPLADFLPQWLERISRQEKRPRGSPHFRAGCGLSIMCPAHGRVVPWDCRLELPFARPEDGYPHQEPSGAPLFGHHGKPMGGLSIWQVQPRLSAIILVPGHWAGMIRTGRVITYQFEPG